MFMLAVMLLASCDDQDSVPPPGEKFFLKYYGMDGDQVAADMAIGLDGGMWILGTTGERNSFEISSRLYLVKINNEGLITGQYVFGEPGDQAKDIEVSDDGTINILADHRVSDLNYDVKLIRVDANGRAVDSVTYGYPGVQRAKTVTELDDHTGYIITGSTEYDTAVQLNPGNPEDISDIFHYRCNSALQFDKVNWYEQSGSGTFDSGIKVFDTQSGSFYVFGSSNQFHPGNQSGSVTSMYYSRINNGGVTTDFNFLGDFDTNTQSSFIAPMPLGLGGGFLVVGTKTNGNVVSLQVAKLRSELLFNNNDELWDREVSIDARNLSAVSAASCIKGLQGYFILADETASDGQRNIWLTKIDLNGSVMWSRSFGSREEDDYAAAVMEMDDGRILVLGTINLVNGQSKIALMKLNNLGQLAE